MSLLNTLIYPEGAVERDKWVVAQRPPRATLDPRRPYAFFPEQERSGRGEVVSVSTILLTNRECPWRCLMCDLWKNTLTDSVPLGAIPEQIEFALAHLPPARVVKLYNSGSFFDLQAIPFADYPAIAKIIAGFERVILESHPALIGTRCIKLRDLLSGRLEVAMGLETVHPEALQKLNKRVTLDQFRMAAARLREEAIDLRVFILVQPPFVPAEEALEWARRSIDFAFDCHATAVTLIPTRAGNGAMEEMQRMGVFTSPTLDTFEQAVEYGIALGRGRVFADLWDIACTAPCSECRAARTARLAEMSLSQIVLPQIVCSSCGAAQ